MNDEQVSSALASSSATSDARVKGSPVTNGDRRTRLVASARAWGGYAVFVLIILVFGIAEPDRFLTAANLRAVLESAALPILLTLGLTLIVIAGELDLSFTAIAALGAGVAVHTLVGSGEPAFIAVVVTLAVGLAIGLVNGFSTAYVGIPSIVGTLAVSSVALGAEVALTKNVQIPANELSSFIRNQPVGGVSVAVIMAGVLALVMGLVVRFTIFGRHIDAIGGNREAAEISGVPVRRRILMAFAISGLISGLAGIVLVGQSGFYYPNSSAGYLLPAFTAVFLGLAFHKRNQFSIMGSVLGLLMLTTVTNGLIIMNQPEWSTYVIQGGILLIAVWASLRGKRS